MSLPPCPGRRSHKVIPDSWGGKTRSTASCEGSIAYREGRDPRGLFLEIATPPPPPAMLDPSVLQLELRPPPCTTEEREDPGFALHTEPGNTPTEPVHGQKPPTFSAPLPCSPACHQAEVRACMGRSVGAYPVSHISVHQQELARTPGCLSLLLGGSFSLPSA